MAPGVERYTEKETAETKWMTAFQPNGAHACTAPSNDIRRILVHLRTRPSGWRPMRGAGASPRTIAVRASSRDGDGRDDGLPQFADGATTARKQCWVMRSTASRPTRPGRHNPL